MGPKPGLPDRQWTASKGCKSTRVQARVHHPTQTALNLRVQHARGTFAIAIARNKPSDHAEHEAVSPGPSGANLFRSCSWRPPAANGRWRNRSSSSSFEVNTGAIIPNQRYFRCFVASYSPFAHLEATMYLGRSLDVISKANNLNEPDLRSRRKT